MRLLRRHPILAVCAALLLVAVAVLLVSAAVVWRAAHHDGASDHDRADAIVVLGAAQYDGDPSPVFRGRLEHALLLWEQGRADLVLTVGGNRPGDRTTEAEAGRRFLINHGVPADAVIALPEGSTTYESLVAAAEELRERGTVTRRSSSRTHGTTRGCRRWRPTSASHGYPSATWTSGATSEEERGQGYLRETLAYLHYRLFGD